MRDVRKEIDTELSYLRSKFIAIYDPKTAFGNKDLIAIAHTIEAALGRKKLVDNGTACRRCDGKGRFEHECDCEFCYEKYVDCNACGGSGILEGEEAASLTTV